MLTGCADLGKLHKLTGDGPSKGARTLNPPMRPAHRLGGFRIFSVLKERRMEEPSIELKAIETVFDGHHFRSRLEARWAKFFQLLNIPYQYEPEGFNLNGLFYLPDFWLPNQDCFFEVKGPFTENKGPEKAMALAMASGKVVYIFGQIPKLYESNRLDQVETGSAYFPGGKWDIQYLWTRKECCGKLGIQFNGRSARIPCDCDCRDSFGRGSGYDYSELLLAYTAARHHRF